MTKNDHYTIFVLASFGETDAIKTSYKKTGDISRET